MGAGTVGRGDYRNYYKGHMDKTKGAVSYTHLRAHETAPLISYAVFCLKIPPATRSLSQLARQCSCLLKTGMDITRDIEVKNNVTIARAGVGGGGGDSR